ncbi:MAG: hypothetical protein WD992_02200 [Candidatus Levyibacteriota bacterium]
MSGKRQSGQVLLAIVLVMIVGLTVGLSLASRSIISLRTSEEEISSQQALSAAEAGIEQVSKTNISIANGSFLNDTTYNTSITTVEGNNFFLNGGASILKDDGADIWLSDYSTESAKLYANPWSGNLSIYFGKGSDGCSQAALEIVVISGTRANPISRKYALDPCLPRSNSNNFTYVSSGGIVSGKTFPFGTTISVSSGLIARVVPLYFDTPIGVVGDSALPAQGSIISSTGTSGTTTRKVTVFQGFPTLPSEYFPYGLFSP